MTDGLLATDVSRFLRYLGVERQLSPITLLNYQRQLDAMIAMADDMHIADVARQQWQAMAAQVRGLAARSRRGGLGAGKPGAAALGAAQFLRLAGQPGRAEKPTRRKGSPRRKPRAICRKISTSTT